MEQAVFNLQPQHQRLKNDQTGKRGQVLVFKFDEFAKSQNPYEFVIPAKAGIQLFQVVLDPGFRRGDDPRDLLRNHQLCSIIILPFLLCQELLFPKRKFP